MASCIDDKTLRVLDFERILKLLSGQAVCAETKQRCEALHPCGDIFEIRRMLLQTDEAQSLILKKGSPGVSAVRSVAGAAARSSSGGALSMSELLNVAHVLRISRGLREYAADDGFEENYPNIYAVLSGVTENKKLERTIYGAIVSEEEMADDASPELASIRRKMRSLNGKVRDVLSDMLRSSRIAPLLQEAIITMRDDRYVIPVKSEHKGEIAGIVHDSSASGATLFIEPMAAVEINNRLKSLAGEEKDEIERILSELSAQVGEYAPQITENYNILLETDFIFAKGKLAHSMNAAAPLLNDDGIIDIKKGRHPLIDPKKVVPTDIYLGRDFDTLVITGPNTGGKTVSLKTLGLFTVMAQCGMCIPAQPGSTIAVFKSIFADIGDEQSIEQSLSTFSAHMVNIVDILKRADYKSLVLFDELGAGTDPVEGAALAVAILERAKLLGAKTAATTHYSEIKLYALTTDRVENAACEFDIVSLRPTYRLLIGVPGKSNAFAISRRLGLSDDIITRAQSLIDGENTRFEDVISSLEKQRAKAERELSEASEARAETLAQREIAQHEKQMIEKQREKILSDARRDAKKIYEQAKNEADKIVKDMQRLLGESAANNRKSIEEGRRRLKKNFDDMANSLSEDVFSSRGTKKLDPRSLILGQCVTVTTMGQTGNILTLPDKKGDLTVQVGILKIRTNINALAPAKEEKKKKTAPVYSDGAQRSFSSVKTEIDLRGQNADDAVMMADKYLDDAALAHLESVSIIHGKGTGVLRSAINDMLRHHPHAKSFRPGRYGEGESGVTVVEIK